MNYKSFSQPSSKVSSYLNPKNVLELLRLWRCWYLNTNYQNDFFNPKVHIHGSKRLETCTFRFNDTQASNFIKSFLNSKWLLTHTDTHTHIIYIYIYIYIVYASTAAVLLQRLVIAFLSAFFNSRDIIYYGPEETAVCVCVCVCVCTEKRAGLSNLRQETTVISRNLHLAITLCTDLACRRKRKTSLYRQHVY